MGNWTSSQKQLSFSWKEPEGCAAELITSSKIQIGSCSDCTYHFTVVTNECITSSVTSENGLFEWKILIHSVANTNDVTPYQNFFVGFIDAHPDKAGVGGFGHLMEDINESGTKHQFAAEFKTMGDDATLCPGDTLTFILSFKTKTVELLQNGAKPVNNITNQWQFTGDVIYPAISKDIGIIECSIHNKYDDISALANQLKKLSISNKILNPSFIENSDQYKSNKQLAEIHKKYDAEEKEGYGNKFSEEHNVDDKKTLLLYNEYKIEAPNSITWNIQQSGNKYRIDWGVRGSFCGLGIGRKRYENSETGDFKVLFHFGFIFNGNDYTLTEVDWNSSFDDKHWMVIDLLNTNLISINLCGSKTASCYQLHEVWQRRGELESRDYKYYRLNPGFCRTSVELIATAINREKKREYELCYDDSVNWYSMKDLSAYTNCMLFVIRMCKLCNMEIPEWKDIIQLFDKWEGSDRFAQHWSHFKKYAKI